MHSVHFTASIMVIQYLYESLKSVDTVVTGEPIEIPSSKVTSILALENNLSHTMTL